MRLPTLPTPGRALWVAGLLGAGLLLGLTLGGLAGLLRPPRTATDRTGR